MAACVGLSRRGATPIFAPKRPPCGDSFDRNQSLEYLSNSSMLSYNVFLSPYASRAPHFIRDSSDFLFKSLAGTLSRKLWSSVKRPLSSSFIIALTAFSPRFFTAPRPNLILMQVPSFISVKFSRLSFKSGGRTSMPIRLVSSISSATRSMSKLSVLRRAVINSPGYLVLR